MFFASIYPTNKGPIPCKKLVELFWLTDSPVYRPTNKLQVFEASLGMAQPKTLLRIQKASQLSVQW